MKHKDEEVMMELLVTKETLNAALTIVDKIIKIYYCPLKVVYTQKSYV